MMPLRATANRKAAIAGCTLLIGASSALAQSGNIVVNPGFENGLSGWTIINPGSVSITTDTVHSGSRALQFTVGSVASGTMALQSFGVRTGRITELSFWCRVDPSPGASYFIDITTGGGPGATRSITNLTPGQWTYFELSQFYLSPTFQELRFYFVTNSSTVGTRVYLDDVRLVPGPGAGCLPMLAFMLHRARRRNSVA